MKADDIYNYDVDFWADPYGNCPSSVYRPVELLVFALIEMGIDYDGYVEYGSALGEDNERSQARDR